VLLCLWCVYAVVSDTALLDQIKLLSKPLHSSDVKGASMSAACAA
jgi:hypothetical protein